MGKHGNEAVFSRLVAVSILQMKLDVFVDIGTIQGGPLGIVSHHLVAYSVKYLTIGRISSTSRPHLGFDSGFASIVE